jgi:acyl-CoA synthetase (AMP-forming)/AMP-acid ligase II
MFHISGLGTTMRGVVDGGAVVIDTAQSFDAAALADLLERERITMCMLVPSQWQELCNVPGIKDRKLALNRIAWGASPAQPSVLHAMLDTFPGASVFSSFGMTETCGTATVLLAADALRKIGSVGKPAPGIEARIVDSEMRDVPVGTVGEVVFRGPSMMLGYWNHDAESDEVFAGGWLHSGDLCRMDDEGFIYVVDRLKDMIISGGENISCAEVEAAIDSHPGVAQVAVIGVEHPRWGQTPWAVIVPKDPANPPSEAEIIEHCRRHIASYKKPTKVVFVADMPRNASGKIQKFKLRAAYASSSAI